MTHPLLLCSAARDGHVDALRRWDRAPRGKCARARAGDTWATRARERGARPRVTSRLHVSRPRGRPRVTSHRCAGRRVRSCSMRCAPRPSTPTIAASHSRSAPNSSSAPSSSSAKLAKVVRQIKTFRGPAGCAVSRRRETARAAVTSSARAPCSSSRSTHPRCSRRAAKRRRRHHRPTLPRSPPLPGSRPPRVPTACATRTARTGGRSGGWRRRCCARSGRTWVDCTASAPHSKSRSAPPRPTYALPTRELPSSVHRAQITDHRCKCDGTTETLHRRAA